MYLKKIFNRFKNLKASSALVEVFSITYMEYLIIIIFLRVRA